MASRTRTLETSGVAPGVDWVTSPEKLNFPSLAVTLNLFSPHVCPLFEPISIPRRPVILRSAVDQFRQD